MKRVSWADLLEEEEEPPPRRLRATQEPPPRRLRATQDPAMPFLAARTLYNDVTSGKISGDLFVRRARHLARVSPDAVNLLLTWLRSHAPEGNQEDYKSQCNS